MRRPPQVLAKGGMRERKEGMAVARSEVRIALPYPLSAWQAHVRVRACKTHYQHIAP